MCRRGLVALVRLEDYERGSVLPHEHTTPGPKADRLALLKAARCNFSPLMSLYRDSDNAMVRVLDEAEEMEPTLSAHVEGPYHYNLRTITDPRLLLKIAEAMASRKIFLADGHHRYEAALRYRDELEASEGPLSHNAAARYIMMTLISIDDPGMLVLPYHRLFGGLTSNQLVSLRRGVKRAFYVNAVRVSTTSAEAAARAIADRLSDYSPSDVVVAALGLEPGEAHLLTVRESNGPQSNGPVLERCDTWALHRKATDPALGPDMENATVSFVQDAVEAVKMVQTGDKQVAFLLRSLQMELFEEIVGEGKRLPPKSTCFYPKLPTGLVINSLQGDL